MGDDRSVALAWMVPVYCTVLLATIVTIRFATQSRPTAMTVGAWLVIPPLVWWSATQLAGRWLALLNLLIEPPALSGVAVAVYLWSLLSQPGESSHGKGSDRELVAFLLLSGVAVILGLFFPSLGESP